MVVRLQACAQWHHCYINIIFRNVVYFNYVDFAAKSGMLPVNAASFGKIIRQLFQNLTTRRLGTRSED